MSSRAIYVILENPPHYKALILSAYASVSGKTIKYNLLRLVSPKATPQDMLFHFVVASPLPGESVCKAWKAGDSAYVYVVDSGLPEYAPNILNDAGEYLHKLIGGSTKIESTRKKGNVRGAIVAATAPPGHKFSIKVLYVTEKESKVALEINEKPKSDLLGVATLLGGGALALIAESGDWSICATVPVPKTATSKALIRRTTIVDVTGKKTSEGATVFIALYDDLKESTEFISSNESVEKLIEEALPHAEKRRTKITRNLFTWTLLGAAAGAGAVLAIKLAHG